jgi:orotate phosphoribosyltransferase
MSEERKPYNGSFYIKPAFTEYDRVLTQLAWMIQTVMGNTKYSVVSSGLSGDLLVLPLCNLLNKRPVIIRKKEVQTHGNWVEGFVPESKYIIIDDLVGQGKTMARIIGSVEEYYKNTRPVAMFLWNSNRAVCHSSKKVQEYLGNHKFAKKLIPCFSMEQSDHDWRFWAINPSPRKLKSEACRPYEVQYIRPGEDNVPYAARGRNMDVLLKRIRETIQ